MIRPQSFNSRLFCSEELQVFTTSSILVFLKHVFIFIFMYMGFLCAKKRVHYSHAMSKGRGEEHLIL